MNLIWEDKFVGKRFPAIKFKPNWLIHPTADKLAFWRVIVSDGEFAVSVYLDVSDVLGWVNQPYYEIYPNLEGETSRFMVTETEELVEAIETILLARNPENEQAKWGLG